MFNMEPNKAAAALLASLSLPYGTVSILPWHENGHVVMHVMIDRPQLRQVNVPPSFEGYDVRVEERQPGIAYYS